MTSACDVQKTLLKTIIWDCVDTLNHAAEIHERGVELFQEALEKTEKSLLSNRDSANQALARLGITPQSIQANPLYRSIITNRLTRVGRRLVKEIPGFKLNWLPLLSASLTRAFWEIIWNTRTAQVQRCLDEIETLAAEEDKQYEARRDEKRSLAKSTQGKLLSPWRKKEKDE
jgi:hypothetical protein